MSEHFPTVGIIGDGPFARMLIAPALALGVNIVKIQIDVVADAKYSVTSTLGATIPISQVKSLESSGVTFQPNSRAMEFVRAWNEGHNLQEPFDAVFSVIVARSPHGQASAWTPTEISDVHGSLMTITPTLKLSLSQMVVAQNLALDLVKQSDAVGVVDVEMVLKNGEFFARYLSLGPSLNGSWTIEGSRTSQFEQHLRAILDLPLGDPSLVAAFSVTGTYVGEGNMYRPYLHLMARSPGLKFHQYLSGPAQAKGHVTAIGPDLLDLTECVTHAVEYMSGEIDE